MIEISQRIWANEDAAYVLGDNAKGQATMKKMGEWGFLTHTMLAEDGNANALRLLSSILPSGMTAEAEQANDVDPTLGICAYIRGERGSLRVPLSEVAKAWLQVYGANAFNEKVAKAELRRLKIKDDQGNPGQWIKGIE